MMTDAEAVLEHLMFHRAIIHEGDRAGKIDHYLDVLEGCGESGYCSTDPVDRSIETVFRLVLSRNLDPWDIDLLEFTRLYYDRMREEVNFIAAGKLVLMAWSILRLQTEETLAMQERQEIGELFCSDWDFGCLDRFLPEDERAEGRHLRTGIEEVELEEVVRRRPTRPVSLIELLEAFDEASREAEANLRRASRKRTPKAREFDERAHAEELERDVEEIWERIDRCGGGPLTIDDICEGTKKDFITVFVSILFLARRGRISLWQDDIPHGQIFFEARLPWDIGTLEDVEDKERVKDGAVM